VIRRAQHEDIPAIMALHERCWRISYAGLADADAKFSRPAAERVRLWTELLPRTRVVVSEGEVAGFVVAGPSRDADAPERTGEIFALYVDPERQGSGFGAALVEHACSELAAKGFSRLTLWTFQHNPASRRFYERLGFAHDGTETSDEDGAIVRYVLELQRPGLSDRPR
jgi:ribosomal protein S18 acetylase RimI-like enzyme